MAQFNWLADVGRQISPLGACQEADRQGLLYEEWVPQYVEHILRPRPEHPSAVIAGMVDAMERASRADAERVNTGGAAEEWPRDLPSGWARE